MTGSVTGAWYDNCLFKAAATQCNFIITPISHVNISDTENVRAEIDSVHKSLDMSHSESINVNSL